MLMDELAFNELSFFDGFEIDLELLFRKWTSIKGLLNLRDHPNIRFPQLQLSKRNKQGYSFQEFIELSTLDEIEKKVFYSQINNIPFVQEHYVDKLKYGSEDALGLTDAYYTEIPSISLDSQKEWSSFKIEADELNLNVYGGIDTNSVEIRNIGDLSHYKDTWLEELIPSRYTSPEEFVIYMERTYSNILFSEDVKYFLLKNTSTTVCNKFEASIEKLNRYCIEYWKRNNVMWLQIRELGLTVRPESKQTMSAYGNQRLFKNETGSTEEFSYHFDVPGTRRAYIKSLDSSKKFFVAAIVYHLDIVSE